MFYSPSSSRNLNLNAIKRKSEKALGDLVDMINPFERPDINEEGKEVSKGSVVSMTKEPEMSKKERRKSTTLYSKNNDMIIQTQIEGEVEVVEVKDHEEQRVSMTVDDLVNDFRNTKTEPVKNVSARGSYKNKYLTKNTLEVLFEAFQILDTTLNLFFHTYQGLKRSSKQCADIWISVMKVRMLMQDSLTHLVEQPHVLSPGFLTLRNEHIERLRESSKLVGKAVHFITMFQKHNESWRFYRKAFLAELGADIATETRQNAETWLEFEIRIYNVENSFETAYRAHYEIEEKKIIRSLVEVQPLSKIAENDNKYIKSLTKMFTELQRAYEKYDGNVLTAFEKDPKSFSPSLAQIVKDNFAIIRIQISIVEDIIKMKDFFGEIHRQQVHKSILKVIESGRQLINEELVKSGNEYVVEEEDKQWPHHLGIKQVGPFRLLQLNTPEQFIEYDPENKTYTARPLGITAMEIFENQPGKVTKRAPVSYKTKGDDKAMRESLKIPLEAETYCYFHPVEPDWSVVGESQEEEDRIIGSINAMIRDFSPLHAVVGHGGFGYFDKNGKLLRINGLAFGEDIFFDGPYFLPSNEGFEKLDTPISGVTLEEFQQRGVCDHGWLSDLQDLKAFELNNEPFFPSEDIKFGGAFFFRYDNSKFPEWDDDENAYTTGGRRTYFQLLDFRELSLKKLKNRNTPLLNRLEFEIAQKKADWDVLLKPAMSDIHMTTFLSKREKASKRKNNCQVM